VGVSTAVPRQPPPDLDADVEARATRQTTEWRVWPPDIPGSGETCTGLCRRYLSLSVQAMNTMNSVNKENRLNTLNEPEHVNT
jgi:hypothetical protein